MGRVTRMQDQRPVKELIYGGSIQVYTTPYVNGVVYLNDEAGHSNIRPPMFYHSKTLKLCYIIV